MMRDVIPKIYKSYFFTPPSILTALPLKIPEVWMHLNMHYTYSNCKLSDCKTPHSHGICPLYCFIPQLQQPYFHRHCTELEKERHQGSQRQLAYPREVRKLLHDGIKTPGED